ncbi:MAG: 50S ribosomal protein L10 [Thermoplasmata archaeon]
MPGRGSVPPERLASVEALEQVLLSRPMTAVVGIRGVPGAALQSMRRELRDRGHPIQVATNTSIRHALENASKKRASLKPLLDQVQDQTAVLAAEGNPFSLYQEFARTRSPTPARGGETAPNDILVPAGTTSFKPGPIVGELQHAGFPAAIEKGKVVLKKDTLIVKAGGTISREVAGLLTRLEIFPLEVGLSLRAVVDGETFYPPEVLNVDLDARRADLARAARGALGLALEIGYATPETLPLLVTKAHRRALGLALAAGYVTKETIEPLFAKAMHEAAAVGKLIGN